MPATQLHFIMPCSLKNVIHFLYNFIRHEGKFDVKENFDVIKAFRCHVSFVLFCLFTVLGPAQGFFTYMETSPLPMKSCKI
jgi:hypothetical protein